MLSSSVLAAAWRSRSCRHSRAGCTAATAATVANDAGHHVVNGGLHHRFAVLGFDYMLGTGVLDEYDFGHGRSRVEAQAVA